jgi:hypothetical protein
MPTLYLKQWSCAKSFLFGEPPEIECVDGPPDGAGGNLNSPFTILNSLFKTDCHFRAKAATGRASFEVDGIKRR